MQICDLCRKTVDRLERLPDHYKIREVCDQCRYELHVHLGQAEKRAAETRQKFLDEAVAQWRRERGQQT